MTVGSGAYDYLKEHMFYFFGPIMPNRLIGTAVGVGCAVAASMPFDAVATRMHTMRPLPNGQMPYLSSIDCFTKILKHECSFEHLSNFGAFYSGGQAYFLRLYLIAIVSQYLLDYYHHSSKVSEYWQPARFHYHSGLDYDIHNPYTDGFNNLLVHSYVAQQTMPGLHPMSSVG